MNLTHSFVVLTSLHHQHTRIFSNNIRKFVVSVRKVPPRQIFLGGDLGGGDTRPAKKVSTLFHDNHFRRLWYQAPFTAHHY